MEFSVYILGYSLSSFIIVILIGSFLDLILSFRSSLPGRRSIGCIGSIIAFLCGMVCLATCLAGWVNSFRLSFGSVTVFFAFVMIIDVAARVRGIGLTVFVSRIILIFSNLFSLFLQQSTVVFVMLWFFTVVARWFVSVSICVYSYVAYSVDL